MSKHQKGAVHSTRGRPKIRKNTNTTNIFGNQITTKNDKHIRIGFQNFSGLSGRSDDITDDSLREWINDKNFDIFGIPEVNLYWPRVQKKLQFNDRVTNWWIPGTTRSKFAYNVKEKRKKRSVKQYGGTAQVSRNQAARREYERGSDFRGLGRWVWQKYRGKGSNLVVITAYRPTEGNNGPFSVNTQHVEYFREIDKVCNPRNQILKDLEQQIEEWKKEDYKVILMMDCNEDIRSIEIQQFRDNTGLREGILSMHGNDAPNTHIGGSKPIDTILISPEIEITFSGYCAFHEGVQGTRADHRCLWLDIQYESIFGSLPSNLSKFEGRRVKSNDPRVVHKFNEHYRKYAIEHKLDRDVFTLHQSAVYPCTIENISRMEKMARKRYDAIAYADRQCRKLRLGKTPFSTKYKTLVNTVLLWRLIIAKKSGRNIKSNTLKRIIKKTNTSQSLSSLIATSKEQSVENLKKTLRQYRKFKRTATSERHHWLTELAKSREQVLNNRMTNTPHHKKESKRNKKSYLPAIIRNIQSNEKIRNLFRRIKYAVKPQQLQGITAIEVTNSQGQIEQITDVNRMAAALRDEYKRKYHQTENTPPMKQPLLSQIGELGIGRQTEDILRGKFQPKPRSDHYANILMQKLSRIDDKMITPGITTEDYQEGWRKAKERTSSGGTILHFGHCKSMAQDDGLSHLDAMFLSTAMKTGYAYSEWRKGIDCTLQKKANSIRIEKLRTIVLLEADFNFVNKSISRKIANKAESTTNCFADEQYGSRKDRRAIEQALNKRLCFDITRQTRRAGAVVITDLKSCYDRVCHAIASLSLRRIGLTEAESKCMFEPLQYLHHKIRCGNGNSKQTYGSDKNERPMQGLYQGNGAGPVIWAAVSSPILQILRDLKFGTQFVSGITGARTQIVGFAFVDDTDLIQTAKQQESIHDVMERLQDSLNHWEGLIKATGGALSVGKCRWWAMDFEWTPGGSWKLKKQVPNTLTAIDHNGTRQPITQLETNEAFETLGVYLAPNGDNRCAVDNLRDAASKWSEKLRRSFLQSSETYKAITTTIMKKLEYPLTALTLTEKECDTVMYPILQSTLPRTHFSRHFCRRTLYAPGGHLGWEFPNLYASQITSHIEAILRHGPRQSITGNLIRESIEHCKIELGLPGSLFNQNYQKHGHLVTDCWIKTIWRETNENRITLTEKTPNLTLNREHDQFIMAILSNSSHSPSRLRRFNRSRLYARVQTLSDITTGDGRHIIPEIVLGDNPMEHLHRSRGERWPNQARPSQRERNEFLSALRTLLTIQRNRLRQPLGQWLRIPDPWHPRYNQATATIYIRKTTEGWHSFRRQISQVGQTRPKFTFHNVTKPPPEASMAVAWESIANSSITNTGIARYKQATQWAELSAFDRIVHKIQAAPSWTFKTKPQLSYRRIQRIHEAILSRSAIAVTDGSFKEGNGTSAMCILSPDVWQSTSSTPGPATAVTPYRCELAGILSVMIMLEIIASELDVAGGLITIACDNMTAGKVSLESQYLHNPTQDHFDILQAIFVIRKSIKCEVRYRYVEGHQRERYGETTDEWAKLNDQMDAMAKAVIGQWNNNAESVTESEWKVSLNNIKVCKKFKHTINRHINAQRIEAKWTTPSKSNGSTRPPLLSHAALAVIDFASIQQAWDTLDLNEKRFVVKISSRQLPVGRHMFRLGYWKRNKCPMCLQAEDDHLHFLQCTFPPAAEYRQSTLQSLYNKLRNIRTDPQLVIIIQSLVDDFCSQSQWHHPQFLEETPTIRQIKTIGIIPVIHGRYPRAIFQQQEQYNNDQGIRAPWPKQFLPLYWRTLQRLWFFRNKTFHSSSIATKLLWGVVDLDRQIRELWNQANNTITDIPPHPLTKYPLQTILKRSKEYKEKWIQSVTS